MNNFVQMYFSSILFEAYSISLSWLLTEEIWLKPTIIQIECRYQRKLHRHPGKSSNSSIFEICWAISLQECYYETFSTSDNIKNDDLINEGFGNRKQQTPRHFSTTLRVFARFLVFFWWCLWRFAKKNSSNEKGLQ